ncbi:MAG: leucine-rich repeat protein [Clostridiales bacterium]|nr:leucine-rich repeat protein [Clostridiales bacterium]
MEERAKRSILTEKFKRYNVSYPVIVKGWEITRGADPDQRNLYIQFQKICDEIIAFKIIVTCLNAFGEVIKTIPDISVKDVQRKRIDFFECIPLAPNTENVNVTMMQYVLSDATIGPMDYNHEIIEYEFKRFESVEDEQAGERLLKTAKGYPIEKGTHWYCACGRINWQRSKTCIACKKEKRLVFSKITEEAIQREKQEYKQNEETRATLKRKRRKLITSVVSALLIFSVLISILCATVIPIPTITINDLKFKRNDSGYALVECKSAEEHVTIPSKVRGLSVTEIGPDAFYGRTNLKSVDIPDTVISIGDDAFAYCNKMTEIVIPHSVKYMGYAAFRNSTVKAALCDIQSKTEFWLDENDIYIWNYSEYGTTEDGLKWVLIKNGDLIIYDYIGNSEDLSVPATIKGHDVTIINNNAFKYRTFKTAELPDTVTQIGDNAFRSCDYLTNVKLSNNLKSIGSFAFAFCENLTSIVIPQSVTEIDELAFYIDRRIDITINCEAQEKPEGWNFLWSGRYYGLTTIVWGYAGE